MNTADSPQLISAGGGVNDENLKFEFILISMHPLRNPNVLKSRNTCSFRHRLRSNVSLMVGSSGMGVAFGLHSV